MDEQLTWRKIKKFSDKRSKFSLETYFSSIYHQNLFLGSDSRSGQGSDLKQTETIREMLPKIIEEYKITSIGDLPCGDFHWMSTVNLSGIQYRGYDIASALISDLNLKFRNQSIEFQQLNAVTEVPRKHDLIICRDLLVHLSFDDAKSALENIQASGSTFLLTTTFTDRKRNRKIKYRTAKVGWYPINLEKKPFYLESPVKIFNENCREGGDLFLDKSLALFRISELNVKNEKSSG
jgi:hypothetical protein